MEAQVLFVILTDLHRHPEMEDDDHGQTVEVFPAVSSVNIPFREKSEDDPLILGRGFFDFHIFWKRWSRRTRAIGAKRPAQHCLAAPAGQGRSTVFRPPVIPPPPLLRAGRAGAPRCTPRLVQCLCSRSPRRPLALSPRPRSRPQHPGRRGRDVHGPHIPPALAHGSCSSCCRARGGAELWRG